MGGINFPLLSDFWPHGEVAKKYGVLREDGRSERAIFIIDEDGVIQYIDIHDIDDQPSNDELMKEIARINPEAATASADTSYEEEPLPSGGVVLYCTTWCPACRRARKLLEANNIDYREIDVGVNRKGAAQVREWADGNLTTPTFDIDGTIIVDYDEQKLKKVLKVS